MKPGDVIYASGRWSRQLPDYRQAVVHLVREGVARYGNQRGYAEQFDAHPSDIAKWHTGYSQPSSETLWRMVGPLDATFVLAVPRPGGYRLHRMDDLPQAMRTLRAALLGQYGTLRAIGARTGIAPSQLSRWFSGKVKPSGFWLWILADTAGARILLASAGYR